MVLTTFMRLLLPGTWQVWIKDENTGFFIYKQWYDDVCDGYLNLDNSIRFHLGSLEIIHNDNNVKDVLKLECMYAKDNQEKQLYGRISCLFAIWGSFVKWYLQDRL